MAFSSIKLNIPKVFPITSLCFLIIFVACSFTENDGAKHRTAINGSLPNTAFNAEISVLDAPDFPVPENRITEVKLKVKNTSNVLWPAGSDKAGVPFNIYLSYRWLSEKDAFISEGLKTPLPHDIGPGEDAVIYAKLFSLPLRRGSYIVEFDLLQESVSWFACPVRIGVDSIAVYLDPIYAVWEITFKE